MLPDKVDTSAVGLLMRKHANLSHNSKNFNMFLDIRRYIQFLLRTHKFSLEFPKTVRFFVRCGLKN